MAVLNNFLLKGRIVTMVDENHVIPNGYLLVSNGKIKGIYEHQEDIPASDRDHRCIETNGSIYPGLIDLHNHFVYNVLPLWVVPRRYDNRSQWPAHPEYRSGVSKPIRQALANYSISAKALVRYVEAKALLGGTTTGQGMRTRVKGGSKMFIGAMRNVEEPLKDTLPPAGTRVPDLYVGGATADERIQSFRNALNKPGRGAYFYHLSEGIDNRARKHFFNLKDYDLINDKLVGIHSLGLSAEDLQYLAQKGAKVVWSPFSNQLLYGKTLDLQALKASGLTFSIGCDWTPTGSKNLLLELKVAAHSNQEQGKPFSDFDLVKAVTTDAAKVTAWHGQLGTLETGKLADLLIIPDKTDDPYQNLIGAVEKDVELVVIDGIARYGSKAFMEKLHPDTPTDLEHFEISSSAKSFYLNAETSEINDITFTGAWETLQDIMMDLPGFVDRMEQEKSQLMSLGEDPTPDFGIELDNEFSIHEDVFREDEESYDPALLADVPMADSVELDSPTVEGDSYARRIDRQENISQSLKDYIKTFYDL